MTIPASGVFTDATCRTEWGLGLPLTSAQLGTAAGRPAAYTSESLRGLSAADYVPNAMDWVNLSASTNDGYGSATAVTNIITIAGINQPITLRFAVTSFYLQVALAGSTGAHTLAVLKNGTQVGSHSSTAVNGSNSSANIDVVVSAGDTIQLTSDLTCSNFNNSTVTGTGGGTVTVTNLSSGSTQLDTLGISISCTWSETGGPV